MLQQQSSPKVSWLAFAIQLSLKALSSRGKRGRGAIVFQSSILFFLFPESGRFVASYQLPNKRDVFGKISSSREREESLSENMKIICSTFKA